MVGRLIVDDDDDAVGLKVDEDETKRDEGWDGSSTYTPILYATDLVDGCH